LEALIRQLEGLARQRPVLMVFEDAHWVDPSSRDLLDLSVERMRSLPVLLIVTFRPEFRPPWTGQPQVTMLALNRLDWRDRIALAIEIAGGKTLPDEVAAQIIERTDGVPLFIEELTRSVLESGSLREETDRFVLDRALPPLAIPATLHDSLLARLDRLGPARHVAQIGAAIGREFSYAVLRAVSRISEDELHRSLARLVASELVFERGAPPHATYLFKHALVQDAAYGALPRESRRALHAQIADAIEAQFPDVAENRPELLARHCAEAGRSEKAARLWGKAGLRSLARSAIVEAEVQFSRALGLIASLPSTPALRGERIKFEIGLANTFLQTKGYAARETRDAFEQAHASIERAEALGEALEGPLARFSVLYGLFGGNYVAFNRDASLKLAARFLKLAEEQRSTGLLIVGHRMMGGSLLFAGQFVDARTHLDRSTALYDPVEHLSLATRFGHDSRAGSLSGRSTASWMLGLPEAARADADRALVEARGIGHALTLLNVLVNGGLTQLLLRDYKVVKAQMEELIAVAKEIRAPIYIVIGTSFLADASVQTGNPSEAIRLYEAAMGSYRNPVVLARPAAYALYDPLVFSNWARAEAELGRVDAARRRIDETITMAEASGQMWFHAETHRIAGEIELMSPERDAVKAQSLFERALEIARAQQGRSWELRAATSLARLWRDQGKRASAHDLLAHVYGWFTEGFETLDLMEAAALLGELAP
jgi:tetratricopeptide (TPR) repeat protein